MDLVNDILQGNLTPDEAAQIAEASQSKIDFLLRRYWPQYFAKDRQKLIDLQRRAVTELDRLDPTHGKYLEWLVKQWKQQTILLPEDEEKVTETLTRYNMAKTAPQFPADRRDINSFRTLGELTKFLDEYQGGQSKTKTAELNRTAGQKVIIDRDPFKVVEVTSPEAAADLFKDTRWCVKDPRWFKRYGPPFYLILRTGEKVALLHTHSEQLMDPYDESIPDRTNPDDFDEIFVEIVQSLFERDNCKVPDTDEWLVFWGDVDILQMNVETVIWYYKKNKKRNWPAGEQHIIKQFLQDNINYYEFYEGLGRIFHSKKDWMKIILEIIPTFPADFMPKDQRSIEAEKGLVVKAREWTQGEISEEYLRKWARVNQPDNMIDRVFSVWWVILHLFEEVESGSQTLRSLHYYDPGGSEERQRRIRKLLSPGIIRAALRSNKIEKEFIK